jgi:hypothetical protein
MEDVVLQSVCVGNLLKPFIMIWGHGHPNGILSNEKTIMMATQRPIPFGPKELSKHATNGIII